LDENKIINGKRVASNFKNWIFTQIEGLKNKDKIHPGIAVVIVGDDPASKVYVRNKVRVAEELGMNSFTFSLPQDIAQYKLSGVLKDLSNDDRVNGILLQLPLPSNLDEKQLLLEIDPIKDVDGLHPLNAGLLMSGAPSLIPCTPLGCKILLRKTLGSLSGKDALVIGRSMLFGKPMAQLLISEHCTVTTAHSRTRDLKRYASKADILIVAVGSPKLVKGSWVKKGSTVIDVGINRIANGDSGNILVGDVDFDEALTQASFITPVPGGVGPMTIASLMYNTLYAACLQNGVKTKSWESFLEHTSDGS